jgi:deoxyribose-phosphate aldolase
MTQKQFNAYFDHTLLKAQATSEDIKKICAEAVEYGFHSVAVNPCYIKECKGHLKGSGVKILTVVGFPLGANTIESKVFEAKDAISLGADEIDYVLNVGKVRSGDFEYIKEEMQKITAVCKQNGAECKVILENCYLTDEQKIKVCQIAKEVRPDFVKTSTGFGTGCATVEDVKLMKQTVGDLVKVKAAGGVRDLKTALLMIENGADRIGCSGSVEIANQFKQN